MGIWKGSDVESAIVAEDNEGCEEAEATSAAISSPRPVGEMRRWVPHGSEAFRTPQSTSFIASVVAASSISRNNDARVVGSSLRMLSFEHTPGYSVSMRRGESGGVDGGEGGGDSGVKHNPRTPTASKNDEGHNTNKHCACSHRYMVTIMSVLMLVVGVICGAFGTMILLSPLRGQPSDDTLALTATATPTVTTESTTAADVGDEKLLTESGRQQHGGHSVVDDDHDGKKLSFEDEKGMRDENGTLTESYGGFWNDENRDIETPTPHPSDQGAEIAAAATANATSDVPEARPTDLHTVSPNPAPTFAPIGAPTSGPTGAPTTTLTGAPTSASIEQHHGLTGPVAEDNEPSILVTARDTTSTSVPPSPTNSSTSVSPPPMTSKTTTASISLPTTTWTSVSPPTTSWMSVSPPPTTTTTMKTTTTTVTTAATAATAAAASTTDAGRGNLTACQGGCRDDDDCLGDLVCHRRRKTVDEAAGQEGVEGGFVPGCGNVATNLPDEAEVAAVVGLCIVPVGPVLRHGFARPMEEGNGTAFGLGLGMCEGSCDSDADCTGELRCFAREDRERVPGCFGTGTAGSDYCYDPTLSDERFGVFESGVSESGTDSENSDQGNGVAHNTPYENWRASNGGIGSGSLSTGEGETLYDTFSFYVMGDVPYSTEEEELLRRQLEELNADEALWAVHVGDIMYAARSDCEEWRYERVSSIFRQHSPVPVLAIPGDNEWSDCSSVPNGTSRWHTHMAMMERHWSDRSAVPSLVQHMDVRPENFAFVFGGVLFLGINMIAGTEAGWSVRIDENNRWMNDQMNKYLGGEHDVRAVIVFGHSQEPRNFFREIAMRHGPILSFLGVPLVYFHGNGHKFQLSRPFEESSGLEDFYYLQVDQGGIAPPLKVTIRGTTVDALSRPFDDAVTAAGDDQFVIGQLVKVDRRGGRYTSL